MSYTLPYLFQLSNSVFCLACDSELATMSQRENIDGLPVSWYCYAGDEI